MAYNNRPPPDGRLYCQGVVAKAMGIHVSRLWDLDEAAKIRPYAKFPYKIKGGFVKGYDVKGISRCFRVPPPATERLLELTIEVLSLRYDAEEVAARRGLGQIINSQNFVDREVNRWKSTKGTA